MDQEKGSIYVSGIRSRATKGKSGARAWVATALATQPFDGWLAKLMELSLAAHGPAWRKHDHFGRRPNKAFNSFSDEPPNLGDDVAFLKRSLSGLLESGRNVGLTGEEVERLRWHSAKPTFVTFMQHLGISPKAVRFSGGWKDKNEGMSDVYLREAQVIIMEAQEQVLNFVRSGGNLGTFEGERVKPGEEPFQSPVLASKVADVCAAKAANVGMHEVPAEFLESDMKDGLPDFKVIEREESAQLDKKKLVEMLEDDQPPIHEAHSPGLDSILDYVPEAEDATCSDDDGEAEGVFVPHFVMLQHSSKASRLHLPASTSEGDLRSLSPKCGVGLHQYARVSADENLESDVKLCARCFLGEGQRLDGCQGLCSKTKTVRGKAHRCTGRCAKCAYGPEESHFCRIHDF